jgi:HAD superfamily hydrolase (TIGR01450 family)
VRTALDLFERFVFDLDGTLWRGDALLPHAREVCAEIRNRGRHLVFMTNNGSRSAREVALRLGSHGVAASPSEVVTSGRAARRVIQERGLAGSEAFIIGPPGLIEDLGPLQLQLLDEENAERARVVVVTRDEGFTYAKLRAGARAVARGALFVATNTDPTFPVEDGFWPGGGSIVVAVQAASGGVVPIVAGKPEHPMLEECDEALGGDGATLVVGDRPRSDLESARRMGWSGALVLTGVTPVPDDVRPRPHLVLHDLSDLIGRDLAELAVQGASER